MSTVVANPLVDPILERGRARGRAAGVAYAGALAPAEAHALVQAGAASLVDVRNRFEWEFVGRFPDATLIEWKHYPSGETNPRFVDELKARFGADQTLVFLCRSGVRSDAAAKAASAAGFANSFNILEGFEGDLNDQGHRGEVGGWRKHGLPWMQG